MAANGKSHVISTLAELEALYAEPVYPPAKAKETTRITKAYRALIEASPFFALATNGPNGLDCSPRGDPKGFVRVLDDNTVAVPDRRGNNRIDSLRNLIHDPRVALLFLIPGVSETLRIMGRATISTPVDPRSAGSVSDSRACPPPNSCSKRRSNALSSAWNVVRNWSAIIVSSSAIRSRVLSIAERRSEPCPSRVSRRVLSSAYSSTAYGLAAPSSW